jgi:hypothetical protein
VAAGCVVVAVRVDSGDVRDRKVRGQQAYIRYHTGTRWAPHHEISYQTEDVEEWGVCKPALGFTRLLAGLPTWTLVYRMEKGGRPADWLSVSHPGSLVLPPKRWEVSNGSIGISIMVAGLPTRVHYTMLSVR